MAKILGTHADGSNCYTFGCKRQAAKRSLGDELVKKLKNGKLDIDIDNMPDYRPIIGVDLDGCSVQYEEGLAGNISKKKNLPIEQFPRLTDYSMWKAGWPIKDREEFVKLHTEAVDEGLYEKLEAMPGVSDTLQRLVKDGYRIRIITSRFVRPGQHAEVVRQTTESLDRLGIPYMDIAFTAHKADIRADVYIDDAPYNVDALRAEGKKVIVFGQKYNEGYEGRVTNWDEADEAIRRIAPIGKKQDKE